MYLRNRTLATNFDREFTSKILDKKVFLFRLLVIKGKKLFFWLFQLWDDNATSTIEIIFKTNRDEINSRFLPGLDLKILNLISKARTHLRGARAGSKEACIPLCGNSVCILSIPSEQIRIFKLNVTTLIQVLIETFWHLYTSNLKHLRMRQLRLFITTYHLFIVYVLFKFLEMIWIWNLPWGYFFITEVGQWFNQFDHVTFSKNIFWSLLFSLSFCQIYHTQMPFLDSFKFWHFYLEVTYNNSNNSNNNSNSNNNKIFI